MAGSSNSVGGRSSKGNQGTVKTHKKPADKKKKRVQDRVQSKDARVFYKTIDWEEWQDEFLTTIKKNGSPQYPTAWSFAVAKGKDQWERSVIYWVVGPKVTETKDADGKKFQLTQLDWEELRISKWSGNKQLKIFEKAIEEKKQELEALEPIAKVSAEFVTRFTGFAHELDKYVSGRPFIPDGDDRENFRRGERYLRLQKKALELFEKASKIFARSRGIDMDNPDSLLIAGGGTVRTQVTAGKVNGQLPSPESNELATMVSMVNMIQTKGKLYGMSLPEVEEETTKTIDAKVTH